VSASLLPAAGSMQAGLAAATADGQRDSDLRSRSAISPQTGLGAKPLVTNDNLYSPEREPSGSNEKKRKENLTNLTKEMHIKQHYRILVPQHKYTKIC